MIDDDIVASPLVVEASFRLLSNYDIVGARTVGMSDDSVIGHISTQQYDYITGQYSGLRLDAIRYPFPNVYNEDLIMYSLQGLGNDFARCGEVEQLRSDFFKDLGDRLPYQEYGEILLIGFAEALSHCTPGLLTEMSYWVEVIGDREDELEELEQLLHPRVSTKEWRAFRILEEFHRNVKPSIFVRNSIQYFANLPLWLSMLEEAKRLGAKK
jgi:hypothetical protein